MKSIFYICMALGALLLPVSEGIRDAVVVAIKSVATGIEHMMIRGDYAEIRVVEGDEFDKVINEPGRLVIVSVQSELSAGSRGADGELQKEIRRLPAEVLVAKVIAERNRELLHRLNMPIIPTLQIYSRGKLVRQFSGNINKTEFLVVMNETMKKHASGEAGSSITPLKKDWMPPGIEAEPSKHVSPLTPLNSER